jgi:hypothetical protein
MKIWISIVCLFLILTTQISETFAQTVGKQNAANAVVKIETKFKGTDEKGRIVDMLGNGTGWCYNDALHIVTALHVVAGIPDKDISVFSEVSKKRTNAKVIKVLKEADLALLELASDIGLKPLTLDVVDPNSTNEFYVWGYPHGIPSMAGDYIRFSLSHGNQPILNNLLQNEKLKEDLEKQKYPQLNAKILRVSSTIQPGHSGAPIINNTGKVIGIADGGLRAGTARLNWAFPASLYVPQLYSSNERPFPVERSIQSNLYSSNIIVTENNSAEEQYELIETDVLNNTTGNDNQSVTKTWTASYDEITETLFDDDIEDIKALSSEFNINMADTWYDVYEDYNTGATITIPAGENLVYDNGWFHVNNKTYDLSYSALIYDGDEYDNAKNWAFEIFQQVINSKIFVESADLWISDENDPDDIFEDDEEQYASYFLIRYYSDENKDLMLLYNAEIDFGSLLVVTMVCDLTKMEDAEYQKQFLHYLVALNLADFTGY